VTVPESDVGVTPAARPPGGLPAIHESMLPREHPLHRPRHGGRQRTALLSAAVFFLVPALAFVFGVRPQAFENHRLAAFPGLSAGWGFFTGLANWATDNLPLRDAGVRAEAGISQGVFGEPPAYSRTDRQTGDTPLGPVDSPPQGNLSNDYSQVIEGSDGWLYYAQDTIDKCTPGRPLAGTIDALRQLRSVIEASGRTFVLVVVPDKTTAVPQYLPADYPDKACAAAASGPFWHDVTAEAGSIDLRAGLASLTPVEHRPAYYPLDTHWTDLGALYMVRSVVESLSPGTTALWRSVPAGTGYDPSDLPPMIGRTGRNHVVRYTLAPDGGDVDRAGPYGSTFTTPQHFAGRPTTGMVIEPVAVLGDSFLGSAYRYLQGAFVSGSAIAYQQLDYDPQDVYSVVASGQVVLLEVVERNLAAGTAQFLEPQAIAGLRGYLAAHPPH
jgi:hypothetical protein